MASEIAGADIRPVVQDPGGRQGKRESLISMALLTFCGHQGNWFTRDLGNGAALMAALRPLLPFNIVIKESGHIPLGIVTEACKARKQAFGRADDMLTKLRHAVVADTGDSSSRDLPSRK